MTKAEYIKHHDCDDEIFLLYLVSQLRFWGPTGVAVASSRGRGHWPRSCLGAFG